MTKGGRKVTGSQTSRRACRVLLFSLSVPLGGICRSREERYRTSFVARLVIQLVAMRLQRVCLRARNIQQIWRLLRAFFRWRGTACLPTVVPLGMHSSIGVPPLVWLQVWFSNTGATCLCWCQKARIYWCKTTETAVRISPSAFIRIRDKVCRTAGCHCW